MADFARLSVAATFHMVPWYSWRKWQKNKPERKMLNLVIPYPTRSSSLTFWWKSQWWPDSGWMGLLEAEDCHLIHEVEGFDWWERWRNLCKAHWSFRRVLLSHRDYCTLLIDEKPSVVWNLEVGINFIVCIQTIIFYGLGYSFPLSLCIIDETNSIVLKVKRRFFPR